MARFGHDGSNAPTARGYEQARILGGGSAINGMGANRGAPADYAEWEAAGAAGWGWDDVLPFFRRAERDLDLPDDPLHGRDGPFPIRRVRRDHFAPFVRAVEDALTARGHPACADQNGAWEDGTFPAATNLDEEGQRASVATAYLTSAVRARPNLAIRTGTPVERLTLDGTRVTGAVLRNPDGATETVRATMTIVSAGAFHSPALLMRSGIGPAGDLAALGIPVAVRLDGVGRNLMEHPSIGVSAFLRPGQRMTGGDRYHLQALLRWSSGLDGTPPGDMHVAMQARSGWHSVARRIGTLFSWVNKSYSIGRVSLVSPDPCTPPAVDLNLLSDSRDLVRLAMAFRLTASVLVDPALAGVVLDVFPSTYSARVKRLLRPTRTNGALTALAAPLMDTSAAFRARVLAMAGEGNAPLATLLSDEGALERHLRRHVGGVWHPCGTCRMGDPDDPRSVCDPAGRVIGVEGLMVCDASLFPTIPCANLNFPVIMTAEKIADGLRRDL
ncbi:GMC family oxidoreductase [Roseomonas sp. CCTCC AB2023176]|uniref:GMC family oxidoreductase n=1 Tax=Roseomonas sp. CCTCC AB2023176 TaxID=3342640 RepID=UPI0035D6E720